MIFVDVMLRLVKLGLICVYFSYNAILMALAIARVLDDGRWPETTSLAKRPRAVRVTCYVCILLAISLAKEVMFQAMERSESLWLLGWSAVIILFETALLCDLTLYYQKGYWANGALMIMVTLALLYLSSEQGALALWLVIAIGAWLTLFNGLAESAEARFGLTGAKAKEKLRNSMIGLPTTELVFKVLTVAFVGMIALSFGYVILSQLGVEFPF